MMMRRLTSAVLFAALCAGSGGVFADDDDEDSNKILVCHKEKESIYISKSAQFAHALHGDTAGECEGDDEESSPEDEAAFVMMRCEQSSGSIEVVALSISSDPVPESLAELGVGSSCAPALADLIGAGFELDATHTGTTGTGFQVEYLLSND